MRQNRQIGRASGDRRRARLYFPFEHRKGRFGHERAAGCGVPVRQQAAQVGGRRQAVCRGVAVVRAALPLDGERLYPAAARVQRAQVFDRECVVRGREQRTRLCVGGADRLLHGRGIGQPGGKALPQRFALAEGQGGRLLQKRKVGLLRAEGQVSYAAERVQQRDCAAREPLGRGQTGRKRRFQHKIRPAAHRGFGARVFLHHRKVAALHEIAAHRAHDRPIRAQNAPRFRNMVRVACVEGVIFSDNAADSHGRISFAADGGLLMICV